MNLSSRKFFHRALSFATEKFSLRLLKSKSKMFHRNRKHFLKKFFELYQKESITISKTQIEFQKRFDSDKIRVAKFFAEEESILEQQITLSREVHFEGIGLHSGRDVSMTLKPAPINSGIQFVRTDLSNHPTVHAIAKNVTATLRATTIEENGAKFFTIEHLMSAIHASQIDNIIIELNSEEPPVADGSSLKFFELIKSAGVKVQDAPKKLVKIDRVYRVDVESEGEKKFAIALPYDGFRVSFTSINPHKLIGIQYADFEIAPEIYEREIAPARTIAFEKEIDQLKSMGLGLGGSLKNVIVYNEERWINPLNFPDELVRHKILDIIGDLRLCGIIRGHIIAVASGHALNSKLAKQISNSLA